MSTGTVRRLAVAALAVPLAGCLVGPDYQRPPPASPPAAQYKELAGWTPAAPADAAPKGDWWTDFHDPLLDELEPLVRISNQTVRADYANYQQALALVNEADAALFPTFGVTGSATRSRGGTGGTTLGAASTTAVGAAGGTGTATTGTGATTTGTVGTSGSRTASGPVTRGTLEATASWDLDIWGKLRRTIEENQATAQSSEATLANATLSAQVTLATTVIDLRVTDANIDLLTKTVAEYREYLRVVSNAVASGYTLYPPSDEITARTQLENTQSSLIALGVARAQYAHAIAVLVGKAPEELDIPHSISLPTLPQIPVGVPSTLLQRRPDIAAAERTVAAENAAIGVAIAAWYPDISLSASDGFSQAPLGALFRAANKVWSIGASGTETVFDFGARQAQVEAARAAYDAAVATYRATVLSAFQTVEDNLAALSVLARQAEALDAAVRDATRGAEIVRNEYQAGTVDYTTVATAAATALSEQQTALGVAQSRLVDAATLIGALGGGWSDAQLHDAQHPDRTTAAAPGGAATP
jgi:NodT family efflux transporter outer membrane factor (OMF) lipoprotein